MQEISTTEAIEVQIPEMYVAKCTRIGKNPEDEVISYLYDWVQARGLGDGKMRSFGFDVPLSAEQQQQGNRAYAYWMQVPPDTEGDAEVKVERFAGGHYLCLRIEDPFSDPFTRIRQGWQRLIQCAQKRHLKVEGCQAGSCLEEVIGAGTRVDMLIYVQLLQ
ncbi:MAG: hypothetical protein PHQ41_00645 [Candidatus Cloacimonetes bacterium]|nr:hypothetical protein [Candidatus Cloacimonadota bacterium]